MTNKQWIISSVFLLLCAGAASGAEVSPKAVAPPAAKLALLEPVKSRAVSNLADSQALIVKAQETTASSDLTANASGLILIVFGLISFIIRSSRARV